jgi:hypothetical protein
MWLPARRLRSSAKAQLIRAPNTAASDPETENNESIQDLPHASMRSERNTRLLPVREGPTRDNAGLMRSQEIETARQPENASEVYTL